MRGGTKVLQNGHQSATAQVVIGIEAGADSEFLLFDLPLAY